MALFVALLRHAQFNAVFIEVADPDVEDHAGPRAGLGADLEHALQHRAGRFVDLAVALVADVLVAG
ncbi:hypothetical protein D3C85_1825450 [compost metagenome]